MTSWLSKRKVQLRAIALLLVLVAGGIVAPVSSAAIAHVNCGMECCQESGECCCLALRLAINDIDAGSDDYVRVEAWQKQCASNCATAVAGFSNEATPPRQTALIPVSYLRSYSFGFSAQIVSYDFLRHCKSSPRAPPPHSELAALMLFQ